MDSLIEQLLEYLRETWRRRFVGLTAAWVIAIAGVIALVFIPDQYEANARIYVDTQSVLKPLMSGLAVQPDIDQQVAMLSRTLLSRPNLEKLVRMADLDLELKTQEKRDALIDRLVKGVEVRGSPSDNLYSLRYRDANPDRSKRVVDSLLSIFVESGLGGKRRDTEKAQQFIDEQIKEYERRLEDSERRLKDFKLRNLGTMGGGTDALSSMIALEGQLGSARMELRAAEQSRDVMKRELAGEEPVFLPDGGSSAPSGPATGEPLTELDTRIETMQKNLDELLRRYTDQHPDVVGTRRIIAELERQKKDQLEARRKAQRSTSSTPSRAANVDRNPVYQQLKLSLTDAEANVAALRARVDEIDARYNQMKSTAKLKPELEEELVQLNRDYQVQKANYDGLIARRESAQLTSQMEQTASIADFRIIDPPRVSPKPVAPNRLLLLGAVVALSLGGGLLVSFGFSQLFPTFHTTRALRRVLDRPVLGSVTRQEVGPAKRHRRLSFAAFVGGLGGLFALYGSVWVVLLLTARSA
jgi:protein tyrosine kinase modulator